jgi:hypothetical protein
MRDVITLFFARCNQHDIANDNTMGRVCSTNGKIRNTYSIMMEKPQGKKPPEKLCRWEDNIKTDGTGVMNYSELTRERDQWRYLVKRAMNL